jgi:hypothetical protein
MSTKRIVILGGGFGGVKYAETLRAKSPLAVAFGRSCQSARTKLLQSLATPFETRSRQWHGPVIDPAPNFSPHTDDGSGTYRAMALLASRQTRTQLRALIWSATIHPEGGGLPQNSCISGDAYWGGQQLDEVAAPIRLVWRLRRPDAPGNYRVEI